MKQTDKKSLLLVDDEPDVLLSLKGLLRRDFHLHTAESGEEALRILDEHAIDIVMSDQRMPGMSGSELMIQIKERFPETVRIVFTGYADIKAVIDGVNGAGLYRYIAKPWDPDDLLQTLHAAGSRHAQRERHLQTRETMRKFTSDVVAFLAASAGDDNTGQREDLLRRGSELCRDLSDRDEGAVLADS